MNKTAKEIVKALGGAKQLSSGWLCRCPAHDDKNPSLKVTDGDDKVLVFCHAGCSQDEVINALNSFGLWLEKPPTSDSTETSARQAKMFRVWHEALLVVPGDPVDGYLRRRGVVLEKHSNEIRYHPSLEYWESSDDGAPKLIGTFPAMIAAVRAHNTGQIVNIHRTYLHDRGKAPVAAPKKLMQSLFDGATRGAAIQLFYCNELLAVSEGIETALAIHAATDLPVWASGSAALMEVMELPMTVKEVIICADLDESGRGVKAAQKLALRMMLAGKKVSLAIPPEDKRIGKSLDWADVLGDFSHESQS